MLAEGRLCGPILFRAVANFAKAMMSRSKTDPMDAAVLREFAERMPFVEWVPSSQEALELRAASR